METRDRRGAAARCVRLAGRIRQVQGHPAIPRTQRRDGSRRVQDDLLVGMDASAAGTPRRGCVLCSVSVGSLARVDRAAGARRALDWFLLRRRDGCCWAGACVIFGLGAALGVVGVLMVASGLSGRVTVSQYWLAFHLTLACLIFAA